MPPVRAMEAAILILVFIPRYLSIRPAPKNAHKSEQAKYTLF